MGLVETGAVDSGGLVERRVPHPHPILVHPSITRGVPHLAETGVLPWRGGDGGSNFNLVSLNPSASGMNVSSPGTEHVQRYD